jgi:hypothetical protein
MWDSESGVALRGRSERRVTSLNVAPGRLLFLSVETNAVHLRLGAIYGENILEQPRRGRGDPLY